MSHHEVYHYTINGKMNELLTDEDIEFTVYTIQHQHIHQGILFSVTKTVTIPAETSYYFCGRTGKNLYPHFTPPIISTTSNDVEIMAYEGTDYNENGSVSSYKNHNRTSNTITTWQDFRNGCTINDLGTVFYTDFVAGSTGLAGTTSGGANIQSLEWILKLDTNYCLEIKNNSDSSNKVNVKLFWYESDDH